LHSGVLGLGLVLSLTAGAQPRFAVHPLEVGNAPKAQSDQLAAQLEVLLARLPGVKLAGTGRLEDALAKGAASRCDARDSCLRFLAEATDSLYGVYVRLDMVGHGAVATARVVRIDGAVVRNVTALAPERPAGDRLREALAAVVKKLELAALPDTLPVGEALRAESRAWEPPPAPAPLLPPSAQPLAWEAPPAPLFVAAPERSGAGPRRVAGVALVAAGGAAVVVGCVFAGLAANGVAGNPPSASGLVAPERAGAVATSLSRATVASVLLPAGAAVGLAGALLLLLPRAPAPSAVQVAFAPMQGGLAVALGGSLP
jgi:hypothetical protein